MSEAKPGAPRRRQGSNMGGFYRLNRTLHGYFSAFAFISLMFFSLTGVTLNHPEWFPRRPPEVQATVELPAADIQAALASDDPALSLAAALSERAPVLGTYLNGDLFEGEALLQFEGPRGGTTATILLDSRTAEISTRPASMVSLLNDLHTGKNAGAAWKLFIDLSAIVFMVLSVIGFILFFSLRFRLATSLALTAGGLAAMLALFWMFVR
jgi:hypothetical protein